MSGFNRAERRRQERAAAKGRLVRVVQQQRDDDCHRAAVASVLGIAYDETPEVLPGVESGAVMPSAGFTDHWQRWAAGRGLAFRTFHSHAPAFLDAWIAVVEGHGRPDLMHSVVMRRGRLAHDPSDVAEARRRTVRPDDVRSALIVGRPEWIDDVRKRLRGLLAEGSPDVWLIDRPADLPEGVVVLRSRGRHDEADAMWERINRRDHA